MSRQVIELRVYAKDKVINKKDGTSVKKLEFSYTPNGQKFVDIVFMGVSKPNKSGYWLVKMYKDQFSPDSKNGKPKKDKEGNIIKRKNGEIFIPNDKYFINEVISLRFDEEYEEQRNAIKEAEIDALLALDDDLVETTEE